MTLVQALEALKEKGITCLCGMHGKAGASIDFYIDNARQHDEHARIHSDQGWAQYHMEHLDDSFIIETNDGHHIIASRKISGSGVPYSMATYSDYATDAEMSSAFEEWEIDTQANEIADQMMAERPGELTREGWLLIATAELREALKANKEAFEREFSTDDADGQETTSADQ
jgi:hypothetical protein